MKSHEITFFFWFNVTDITLDHSSRLQPPRRAASPRIRRAVANASGLGRAVRGAGGVLLPGARRGAVDGTAVAPVSRIAWHQLAPSGTNFPVSLVKNYIVDLTKWLNIVKYS